jgi:DNA mismatch repair ATPase MutS
MKPIVYVYGRIGARYHDFKNQYPSVIALIDVGYGYFQAYGDDAARMSSVIGSPLSVRTSDGVGVTGFSDLYKNDMFAKMEAAGLKFEVVH